MYSTQKSEFVAEKMCEFNIEYIAGENVRREYKLEGIRQLLY